MTISCPIKNQTCTNISGKRKVTLSNLRYLFVSLISLTINSIPKQAKPKFTSSSEVPKHMIYYQGHINANNNAYKQKRHRIKLNKCILKLKRLLLNHTT